MKDLLDTVAAAFGTVAALGFLAWLGLWLWDRGNPLPPPRPPERLPRAGNVERDALLTYPVMRKRTWPKSDASGFDRPLDVAPNPAGATDQSVLPRCGSSKGATPKPDPAPGDADQSTARTPP